MTQSVESSVTVGPAGAAADTVDHDIPLCLASDGAIHSPDGYPDELLNIDKIKEAT